MRINAILKVGMRKCSCLLFSKNDASNAGGALVYILIAIALLAALTVSFIEPSNQQSRSQNAFQIAATLKGQVNAIRAAIQDCILLYPSGDGTINSGSTTDTGYHAPFPVNPSSAHFDSSSLDGKTGDLVGDLSCPGNNGGSGSENEHSVLFGGATGRFMPEKPSLFNDWTYFNGSGTKEGQSVDGVYFLIDSDKTDPYIGEALSKLDAGYNQCETDYIDGDGTNGCADGAKCLRVWVKRITPSCP